MEGVIEAMMTCDGDSLWLMLPAGLQQRDLDGRLRRQLDNGQRGLQQGQLNLDGNAVRRTISGASSRGLLQWLPESERFQPVPVRLTAIHVACGP